MWHLDLFTPKCCEIYPLRIYSLHPGSSLTTAFLKAGHPLNEDQACVLLIVMENYAGACPSQGTWNGQSGS